MFDFVVEHATSCRAAASLHDRQSLELPGWLIDATMSWYWGVFFTPSLNYSRGRVLSNGRTPFLVERRARILFRHHHSPLS